MAADDAAVLENKKLEEVVCARIATQLHNFPGYARVHRATVSLEPWTVENGLITPTLKLRRNLIHERFGDVVNKFYEGH